MINVRKGKDAWDLAIKERVPIFVWLEEMQSIYPSLAVDARLGLQGHVISTFCDYKICPTEDHIPECVDMLLYKLSYLFLHDKIAGEDVNEGGSI